MIMIRITICSFMEKQKEVMQTLISLIEAPGKESGCLSYGIFCDIKDKNVFNLISEWETREDLDEHITSNRFSVLLGTKSLLCEPPKIEIHMVSHSEGMEAIAAVRSKRNL
ncbi:putative quinol monooxygenase [Thermodesulfobacteriota bacterium]